MDHRVFTESTLAVDNINLSLAGAEISFRTNFAGRGPPQGGSF